MMNKFYAIRVGHDSTGSHLEYYINETDYNNGIGYPVNELDDELREQILLDVLNGKYIPKKD